MHLLCHSLWFLCYHFLNKLQALYHYHLYHFSLRRFLMPLIAASFVSFSSLLKISYIFNYVFSNFCILQTLNISLLYAVRKNDYRFFKNKSLYHSLKSFLSLWWFKTIPWFMQSMTKLTCTIFLSSNNFYNFWHIY